MYFVDTHCHLDLFSNIQAKAVEQDNLPIKTITVTNSPTFFSANYTLFKNSQNIRVALGLHPELVPQFQHSINAFEKLINETKYIGEVGLDGSKEHSSNFSLQIKVLKTILAMVRSANRKIITVHSRNAAKETIEIIDNELKGTSCKTILHWFTGSNKDMQTAIDLGYYFSINHKMLSTQRGLQLINSLPLKSILTETDSPFTFNDVIVDRLVSLNTTVKGIAEIKQQDFAEVKEGVYSNFRNLLAL